MYSVVFVTRGLGSDVESIILIYSRTSGKSEYLSRYCYMYLTLGIDERNSSVQYTSHFYLLDLFPLVIGNLPPFLHDQLFVFLTKTPLHRGNFCPFFVTYIIFRILFSI